MRKECILKLIKRNLQVGMKQGIYRRNLNTDIIAVFYTFLLDIKVFEMYNGALNEDFDKMFNTFFTSHIYGIANKEGIEYIEKKLKNLQPIIH